MAVLNRVLNIIILLMAIAAVALGWKLYDRRKELRSRGDLYAKTIANTADILDEKSPDPIGDKVDATDNGAKGNLGWEQYHADFVGGGGSATKTKNLMDTFEKQAEMVRGQRDQLSEYIVGVGAMFDQKGLKVETLNDPGASDAELNTLKDHLQSYYDRERFLVTALKDFNVLLDSDFDWNETKLMEPQNYRAAEAKVTEGIRGLQDMNRRYSDALSQAVAKLGGEKRLGVTAERIREVNPADVESMFNGIDNIMDTVGEVENLRVQIKAVEEQLAKAKDELDKANEEIAQHLIRIDSQKKVVEGQKVKIRKLNGIISKMKGTGGGPTPGGRDFDGRVMKVNYDYNYVIIDIGGQDKLVYGTQLSVARDREFICNLEVTKVYKKFAVAEILSLNKQGEVIEGDRVLSIQ